MRLYRVSMRSVADSHHGYAWCRTRAGAEQVAKQFIADHGPSEPTAEIAQVDFKITKESLVTLLVKYASHPNNG